MFKENQYKKAIKLFDVALSIDPKHFGSLMNKGW